MVPAHENFQEEIDFYSLLVFRRIFLAIIWHLSSTRYGPLYGKKQIILKIHFEGFFLFRV